MNGIKTNTRERKKSGNPSSSTTFFRPSFIQPKLTIGKPNDKYEQEADAMSDQVMRMPQNVPGVQTKCAECAEEGEELQIKPMLQKMDAEEEEELQTKPMLQKMDAEEEELQTKPLMKKSKNGGGIATSALTSQLNNSKGSGSPLPEGTNSFMSQAFSSDFSNVKVHTGSSAVQMNQGLNARAFTHGSDIYFNKGQYNPESSAGKGLLAHELTHVVQQGGDKKSINKKVVEKTKPTIQRGFFGKIWKGIKKVGGAIASGAKAIGRGAKWLGGKIASGAKAVWKGLKWFGGKAWSVMKWVGKYLYRVGESAVGFIWSLITEFPKRMIRLLAHLGELIVTLPGKVWKGIKLLFTGDFKGFGKFIWESIKGGAAWVGRLLAKVLDLFAFGEMMDLIWTIIKVNTRKLTSVEKTEAQAVFGNSIALWRVRIDEASLIAWLGKKLGPHPGGEMGVTTFHTINFSRKINAAPCNGDMNWLIHELVHVAQMEHVGMQYMGEAIHAQNTAGYGYGGGSALAGKNLRDFNREQQGDIISDYYNLIHCGSSPHPYAADYQRMIGDLKAGKL